MTHKKLIIARLIACFALGGVIATLIFGLIVGALNALME
jgi:hypothetical protein